jgi:hypothetical protein
MDPLSLLLAREANVVVLDAPFAKGLREQLELGHAWRPRRLDGQRYAQRPFGQKLLDLAGAAIDADVAICGWQALLIYSDNPLNTRAIGQ